MGLIISSEEKSDNEIINNVKIPSLVSSLNLEIQDKKTKQNSVFCVLPADVLSNLISVTLNLLVPEGNFKFSYSHSHSYSSKIFYFYSHSHSYSSKIFYFYSHHFILFIILILFILILILILILVYFIRSTLSYEARLIIINIKLL